VILEYVIEVIKGRPVLLDLKVELPAILDLLDRLELLDLLLKI
jgi:hypothetical protein